MNSSPSALQQASRESDPKRSPVSQTVLRYRAQETAVHIQPGLKFHFNGYQHAQATRAIFEQAQTGAAVLDVNGRIQQTNQMLALLLGYRQEELAGKAFEQLVRGVEQPGYLRAPTEVREGRPILLNRLARKSGEMIECFVDSHVICDERGKVTNFLVFLTDARARIDAEKRDRYESELYRAQALQTLGTLAGGVAHDFNNALEVIIGFASLARIRLAPEDPLHEPLRIIEESARNAAGLARQLLDVSRTSGANKSTINVGELVGAVLTIIRRTFDRKIRIAHQIAAHLPCIKGFGNRLEHAVLNLCINARDAMPQGGTLTIEVTSQTLGRNDRRLPAPNAPGTYVRIAVRDSGAGMTAEIMEQIFVPLFTTKQPGQGTGLGLAMVDRVVKESEGFISVNSKPGEGSEFALYLPAVSNEHPRTIKREPKQLLSGRGTILVVDDEPRVLQFLEKGLTRLGYQVIPAKSGSRACEIYARRPHKIDCVLLDMVMPGMSGLETCTRLREINPNVKVILSSGYSSGRMSREAGETDSVEVLEKPYTFEALSQAIHKIQQN